MQNTLFQLMPILIYYVFLCVFVCMYASLDISLTVPQSYAEIKPVEKRVRPILLSLDYIVMFWNVIVAAGHRVLIEFLLESVFFCLITVFNCVDRTTSLKWSISMKSCIFKAPAPNQRRKACVRLNTLFKIKVAYMTFMVPWRNLTSMETFSWTAF